MLESNRQVLLWERLQYFSAIAKIGSLRKAASHLGASAPTLSRHIHALEQDLKCQLFDRTERGLALTVHGKRLVGRCQEIGLIVGEIEQSIANGTSFDEVRVAVLPSLGRSVVIAELAALSARMPNVRYYVDSSSDLSDFSRDKIDIAIRASRPESGPYVVRRLTTMSLGFYCHRGLASNDSSLENLPLVVLNADRYDRDRVNSHPLRLCPDSSIAMIVRDFEALLSALRNGVGMGLVPDFVARRDPELVRMSSSSLVPPLDIWLVVREVSHRREIVRQVAKVLAAAVVEHLQTAGNRCAPDADAGMAAAATMDVERSSNGIVTANQGFTLDFEHQRSQAEARPCADQ